VVARTRLTAGTTLGYDSWYLLPFGRGSVKIRDNQAYASNTAIDPKYFSNEFDRLAQGATARFTRTVSQSTPLSNSVTGESVPGGAVGNGADLQAWSNWAQQNYRSNWHPIGTAAMMSRDLGGCVDPRNRLVSARASARRWRSGGWTGWTVLRSVRSKRTSSRRCLDAAFPGVVASHVGAVWLGEWRD